MSSRFIVLEGLDGSGISTQSESLRIWCEQHGIRVFVTKEPTGVLAGSLIQAALKRRVQLTPSVIALLFAADRLDHLENEILPHLERDITVISDRYYLSEYAYQSVDLELPWLRELNAKCRRPDITVFLDLPSDLSVKRLGEDVWRSSERHELYEDKAKLSKVRERYLDVIGILTGEGERIEIVDGSRSISDVNDSVVSLVEPLFASGNSPRRKPNSVSPATEEIASKLGLGSRDRA